MDQDPAISRLVRHVGGPAALSSRLDGRPPYQQIQEWVKRGWASPMHLFRLEPLLPPGMSIRDLAADRDLAKASGPAEVD